MPIKVIKGNLFTSSCQTLVNTVNCQGVMGAGIALEFRLRYPDMFERYVEICKQGLLSPGKLWIYRAPEKLILNFPTKTDWKLPSKTSYLTSGLDKFCETYKEKGVTSIAFPLLGADKGGIDSAVSLDIMQTKLNYLDIDIEIYQYDPMVSDDLYLELKTFLLGHATDELTRLLGIRKNIIEHLKVAVTSEEFAQVGQLLKVKGVGDGTLVKVFTYFASQSASNNIVQGNLL